ncbi:MAG: Sugar transferase [Parcubacteria group bacterium Gr01-1014_44]|nr:MAG: Sugar transferase [Parcubacteria group bacterium Gr01-1014_44]
MKKFVLVLVDIAILYAALWLTLLARYQYGWWTSLGLHLAPFTILFIVWLFVFYIANFYEIHVLKNGPVFYANFFRVLIINAVIGMVFFYLIPLFGIAPRRNFFIFLVFFAGLDFLARSIFNNIIAASKFSRPTLIVGLNEQSEEMAKLLRNNPQLGYHLESIFAISDLDQLKKTVEEKKISTIIISPETYQTPGMIEAFYQLIPKKINFYHLSSFYEQISQKVILSHIDQAWFLENLSEGGKNFYEVFKRIFDIIFSVIFGVIALFLIPFIALAIKLSSRGPVFFRQTRVGQLGRKFNIIKFRTMIANAPDGSAEGASGAVWAQENDPRITKIGRFLRKTRLDEIPQLWNILKDDMAFVGPRAERPEFHDQLKNEIPFYEERYLIKPGLTGWAQVQYRYGSTIKDAAEKLQYDLFYIKHRSLILDFSVILKTINIVLKQSGR